MNKPQNPASAEPGQQTVDEAATIPPEQDSPRAFAPVSGKPRQLPAQLGRYRLLKLLGEGGMGAVYLAHDSQLDRQVALKIPSADELESMERFYREARAAAALLHANICPVHDVGQIEGVTYLTMAFIEGQPLTKYLKPKQPLPPRTAATLVRQVALAMQEAHDRGIIHRDLKPGNIMITPRKQPVIMDFGLARRIRSRDDATLTKSGMILGTPAYMPPEQVNGEVEAMGPGCDIYSLGAILFHLLTGRLPFEGTVYTMLAQIVTDPPPVPSSLRPELDPALDAICLKSLAKKPADRYGSMKEFATALGDYLKAAAKLAAVDVTLVGDDGTAAGSRPEMPPATTVDFPPAKPPRRRLGLLVGTAAALAVVLGVVLYVITDQGTIRIELSDPNAPVEVKVDGDTVDVCHTGGPLRLKAGEHGLSVTGKDFETVSKSFTIKRGDNPVLRIELLPTKSAPKPDTTVKAPEKKSEEPKSKAVPAAETAKAQPVPQRTPTPMPSWPTEALREGRVPAPDTSKARRLFDDDFSNPKSGWSLVNGNRMETAYQNGAYSVRAHIRGTIGPAFPPFAHTSNFACQVVGRLEGMAAVSWALALVTERRKTVQIQVLREGQIQVVLQQVGSGVAADAVTMRTLTGPFAHKAIRSGEEPNMLFAVVRDGRLEIYVNHVAVCNPVPLEDELFPLRPALRVSGPKDSHVLFTRATVWSADELPVPKPREPTPAPVKETPKKKKKS